MYRCLISKHFFIKVYLLFALSSYVTSSYSLEISSKSQPLSAKAVYIWKVNLFPQLNILKKIFLSQLSWLWTTWNHLICSNVHQIRRKNKIKSIMGKEINNISTEVAPILLNNEELSSDLKESINYPSWPRYIVCGKQKLALYHRYDLDFTERKLIFYWLCLIFISQENVNLMISLWLVFVCITTTKHSKKYGTPAGGLG